MEPITADQVRSMAHRMRTRTRLGADRCSPFDVVRLPQAGLEELMELMNVERHLCGEGIGQDVDI
eukprot:4185428-Pyramimonas_sp.AAC.1